MQKNRRRYEAITSVASIPIENAEKWKLLFEVAINAFIESDSACKTDKSSLDTNGEILSLKDLGQELSLMLEDQINNANSSTEK